MSFVEAEFDEYPYQTGVWTHIEAHCEEINYPQLGEDITARWSCVGPWILANSWTNHEPMN